MSELSYEPLIPGPLWLILAAAAAVLLLWYAIRRPSSVSSIRWIAIVLLMTLGIATVLALLLNPTLSHELPSPAGKPVLTVLVDDSGSMGTPDAIDGVTRFAAAARIARQIESQFSDRFEVQLKTFDQSVRPASPQGLLDANPNGAGTDLSTAINFSLAEEHPQGQAIVLLSDGIDNAGGGAPRVLEAVRSAKAMAAPIYTQSFGGDTNAINLSVSIPSQQDLAIINQKVVLAAKVTHSGFSTGKATVTLWSGGKEIGRRDALLEPGVASDVNFLVSQEKVGVYSYEVRVDPLPGQTSQANNSASYVLRVVNEPIRVLVLEGKPYWDSKFLTRTLMADPAVALDSVVRLSDTRLLRRSLTHENSSTTQPIETWKIDSDASQMLASADRLRNYQVIVIGRDAEPFLDDNAITNLENWVAQQGGSLLCYRGSPTSAENQRLAKLLPVKWGEASQMRFRVEMTDRGKSLNWFAASAGTDLLQQMPSLASANIIQSSKPLAVVLAWAIGQAGQEPAVVYQPYGVGRVVVVEGAGMWRWAFLAPAYQDQDQVYSSLWHSLMRWLSSGQGLSPGQRYSLRGDKVRFADDEPATATLLAREDSTHAQLPLVQLTADGSPTVKSFSASPLGSEAGVFRINFGQLPQGRYTAMLATNDKNDPTQQIVFDVKKYDQESLDLQSRPDLMARIATDSGGAVLSNDSADDVAQKFSSYLAKSLPPRIQRSTAWDRIWILCAVIAWWTISWIVRRSGGLV
jgi:hypothetical protein